MRSPMFTQHPAPSALAFRSAVCLVAGTMCLKFEGCRSHRQEPSQGYRRHLSDQGNLIPTV